MSDRVILHVDMNNFFASVECIDRPDLVGKPVAVSGDTEMRHGIILAKNQVAKAYGVMTGESISEARRKCPGIVLLPPHLPHYIEISQRARAIYSEYTDRIESFGIDECWLDVTGNGRLWGDNYGEKIANEIRERVKHELKVTVSVGVSFNKILAKFGSDYKKPDAVTVIDRDNFKSILWQRPVGDLLFVGRHAQSKLEYACIKTIEDLATADADLIKSILGKCGLMIWRFANGCDESPVLLDGESYPIKSIGNSATLFRDLENCRDAEITLSVLCESVAARLRRIGRKCTVVKLSVRNTDLHWYERQCKVMPTNIENEIWQSAVSLFKKNHNGDPIRSIGVSVTGLVDDVEEQLNLFSGETTARARLETLGFVLDRLRGKYPGGAVRRGLIFEDRRLSDFRPMGEHDPHPIARRN